MSEQKVVEQRVALAISGAVSLGSYEAGVMYELIKAFKEHNEKDPYNKIVIDVISGASAGAITGAMLAQKLLFDGVRLEDPKGNALYQAWVEKANIDGLLKKHKGDNTKTSLLSNGFVKSIGESMILSRYGSYAQPSEQPHPVSAAKIRLGLALTNLNGIDYHVSTLDPLHSDGKFIQTRHQDRYTVTIESESAKQVREKEEEARDEPTEDEVISRNFAHDKKEDWQYIVNLAQASGAFPFAFSPIKSHRTWDSPDYRVRDADNFNLHSSDGSMAYLDGGVMNNYPLGMARNLAQLNDTKATDYKQRHYFYISPNKKTSTADYKKKLDNLIDITVGLGSSIFNDARFQDWLMTDDFNQKVASIDTRAKSIRDWIRHNLTDEAKTQHQQKLITQLVESIYSDDELAALRDYLGGQYEEDLNEKPLNKAQRAVWLDMIVLVVDSASLTDKDTMNVYTITAENNDLASSDMSSFVGFFDKDYRDHDYLVGRIKACELLNDIANRYGNKSDLIKLKITRRDTDQLENSKAAFGKLGGIELPDTDLNVRKRLAAHFKSRLDSTLKQSEVNWFQRFVIKHFVTDKAIDKYLGTETRGRGKPWGK